MDWAQYNGKDLSKEGDTVENNMRLHRPIDRTIVVLCTSFNPVPCQSLRKALAPYGKPPDLQAKGPFLIQTTRNLEDDDIFNYDISAKELEKCIDIRLSDLRHFLDWCTYYQSGPEPSPRHDVRPAATVTQGCRLSSIDASTRVKSMSMVMNSCMATTDLAKKKGELSPISQLLGTPVRVIKVPGDKSNGNGNNPYASFMMLITDVNDPNWGQVPKGWSGEIRSIFMFREDGKALESVLVEQWAQFAHVLGILLVLSCSREGHSGCEAIGHQTCHSEECTKMCGDNTACIYLLTASRYSDRPVVRIKWNSVGIGDWFDSLLAARGALSISTSEYLSSLLSSQGGGFNLRFMIARETINTMVALLGKDISLISSQDCRVT
jgi:hypothetical protein